MIMNTIITKFGGSSLADANQFRKVKKNIKKKITGWKTRK